MKKFAVFGNPIAQSLSPTIHQMFANSSQEQISYQKREAPVNGFAEAVAAFFADPQAVGCNVTVPFKEQAYAMAVHRNPAATMAGAANTLMYNDDGELCAFNTDGIGLVADLHAAGINLAGAKVLILGAGGAARGVVHPLLDAGVGQLDILNRTVSKAAAIANKADNDKVRAVDTPQLLNHYDVVINSTSASLSGEVPPVPDRLLAGCELAYDMVYSKDGGATVFMQHAATLGATQQRDGLGMLVEQAAAAFAIWTGKQPDTEGVIDFLRGS
ncbi:shikimate dehydrogenase [Alteromonas gilva]|uniref:Shikimate dehydrogenase (NADP(+)) n=1 Tax=Alteromonas gilva TaxID=2987522 RepID=A0ABT5KWK5_9ALTE|nr:shikimate dehydrogenase [Alteromonas gilva]MDC8829130.1 shikimate dehydrogenase [Alteromonas gilva]